MKPLYLTTIILAALLLSSCYTALPEVKRYEPAMLASAQGYMPKPASFDSSKSANYISAGYVSNLQPVTNKGRQDEVRMANIAFNRSHVFKALNLAYGADGFVGALHNNLIEKGEFGYFKNKSVSGYQLKGSVNAFKSFRYSDFRWLGVELYYSQEFGDFQKFRSQIPGTTDYLSVSNTRLLTGAIGSEVLFRSRRSADTRYGFRLAVQHTFGDLNYKGVTSDPYYSKAVLSTYPNATFYFQLRKYFLILEGGQSGRINLGYQF